MAYPRPAALMPEEFEVVFEQPKLDHRSNYRMARCAACDGVSRRIAYGVRMETMHHWCGRGVRTLVIWEAA